MVRNRRGAGIAASDVADGDDAVEAELKGPERRCIVTGTILPKEMLLRFAISPDGVLVPDLSANLPGRGLWVTATHAALQQAFAKNPFSRAAKRQVKVPDGIMELVVSLQRQRLIDGIGLSRRAGSAVAGFEKVEALAHRNRLHCLIIASDAGKDGTRKLEAAARSVYIIDILDSATLGGIFGAIGIVVYAGISDKLQAARLISLAARLTMLMPVQLSME